MMDIVLSQTKTKSFEIDGEGEFSLLESSDQDTLMLLDLDVYKVENRSNGNLTFKLNDDNPDHVHYLSFVDLSKTPIFSYKSHGMAKYWNGANLSLVKDFEGKILVVVQYIKVSGKEFGSWSK